jgi:hypothetical protein
METNILLASILIKRGVIFISGDFEHISHQKFFVVIGENEEGYVGFFFVNSNINNYIASRPDFMDMQMPIKRLDYPDFLTYDSFIGCHELSRISKNQLATQIQNGTTKYKSELTSNDLELLMDALRNSKLYSKIEKDTFFK